MTTEKRTPGFWGCLFNLSSVPRDEDLPFNEIRLLGESVSMPARMEPPMINREDDQWLPET